MHAYEESLTEDYTFQVVLPEGATHIQIELPPRLKNNVKSIALNKYFGTLDFFGRPTITIKQENVLHVLANDKVRVKYDFDNSKDFLLEPVYVFGMVMSLFASAMIYSRLGLNLESSKPLKSSKQD